MAGPAPSKEILQGTLTEARRASEVAKQPPTLANSLREAAVAALAPLAAGNAAVGQVLSTAWSAFQEALWHEEEDAEKEQLQAQEDKVAMLVQRLGILSKEGKDEWRKHIHDPQISQWLRAHRDLLDPRAADEEFQRWLNEPGYEPPGSRPAPEKVVPAAWQPPQTAQAARTATQSIASRDVNAPFDVNTSYDEASGRHVVTINGVPFAAIVAAKETPLEIDVAIVDGNPTLNVSGGLHEVVPLLPPPRGTISSEPVPYSETPALTAEQPAVPAKEPSSGEILEQRARKNYLEGTSPGERFEAAQKGRPQKFMGKLERSLQKFEQTLKSIPGGRAGVSYAQVYWGKDLLDNEVDRWEAFKEGTIAFAEDLTLVLGPEDLMELGAGRAATSARAVEEGVTAVPNLHPNVGPPPVPVTIEARGAKEVGAELENFDRVPQFSPLEQQLREGSLLTPRRQAPQIPEPYQLPPKKTPASAPAEVRLEKPSVSLPPEPAKVDQSIEFSLSPPETKQPGTTINIHQAPEPAIAEAPPLNVSAAEPLVIEPTAHQTPAGVETRRISGLETRPGRGANVAPGTAEGLEPTLARKIGDPTRGKVALQESEAWAYAGGAPSGYRPPGSLGSVYKGRVLHTGDGLSVQAGHLVPKSTGTPGGLAIELTTLNQAAESKLITKQAIEIQGAIVERETAQRLVDGGKFPNLTQEIVDSAPPHAGWQHPVGMSEAEAQSRFMDDQLQIISDPDHPLHQLTQSYEEISGHLPNRPLIP